MRRGYVPQMGASSRPPSHCFDGGTSQSGEPSLFALALGLASLSEERPSAIACLGLLLAFLFGYFAYVMESGQPTQSGGWYCTQWEASSTLCWSISTPYTLMNSTGVMQMLVWTYMRLFCARRLTRTVSHAILRHRLQRD